MNILDLNRKTFKNFDGQKSIIGTSYQGRAILCYTIRKSDYPKIIIQSSMHAREYITAYLTLKLLKDFDKKAKIGCVHFIPIVNPDGVNISLKTNPLYKANARGVDLNVNFDAHWGTGAQNVREKGDQNYIGEYPFSELETKALREFTLKIMPDMTISYHSKGEEIYYEFFQDEKDKKRDRLLAQKIEKTTSYKIKSTPNSAGGYKDWCIEKLKIPSLTIEIGSDRLSHPIKKRHLRAIYLKNKRVINVALQHLMEIKCKKDI